MPTPVCAIFSPAFQSPRYLPSAGYWIVASWAFSSFSATSFGTGVSPWYLLQAFCTSSWSRRSSFACPCSLNEDFISASAFARFASGSCETPAQPAAAMASAMARVLVFFMVSPSALDRGRVEHAAVRVLREVHRERDGSGRDELELGEALLAEAVVEAPLERAHLALRHAIGGPRCVGALGVVHFGEVGQVLQPDACVVGTVAGHAAEIMRAAAEEEDLLPDLVGFLLLRMRARDLHGHAARGGGDVRDQGVHGHLLAGTAERILLRLLRREALQVHHAGHQARLEVLDLVAVRKIPGQHGVRSLHDAGPEAQIALLEARV